MYVSDDVGDDLSVLVVASNDESAVRSDIQIFSGTLSTTSFWSVSSLVN